MTKKYVLLSLEDEKAKHLADVLGNATSKKIIDVLAEKDELSEQDISKELNIPLNTTEYNLKKLLKSELVEKSKTFFWSKKGKKIDTYTLSNKSIIISPKSQRVSSKLKSILPVAVLSGIGAVIVQKLFTVNQATEKVFADTAPAMLAGAERATNIVVEEGNFFFTSPSPAWIWFLSGAIFALAIFAILNWRKL